MLYRVKSICGPITELIADFLMIGHFFKAAVAPEYQTTRNSFLFKFSVLQSY